jgi:uncharacterized membrane protein YgdD (TMEM256/DUF423 family)
MEIKSLATFRWGVTAIGLSIILGAMGAHALEKVLTPEQLKSYLTGVHYLIIHGLALLILSLLAFDGLRWVTRFLKLGIVAFSGSIFLLVWLSALGMKPSFVLVMVTPVGGSLLIIGWFLLLGYSFTARIRGNKADQIAK